MNKVTTAVFTIVLTALQFTGCSQRQSPQGAYTVLTPQGARAEITTTASLVGNRPHQLQFTDGGVVVRVKAYSGMRVLKGDTLMAVDDRELRAEVSRCRAVVDEARLRLEKLGAGEKTIAEQTLTKARIEEAAAGKLVGQAEEFFRQGSMSSRSYDSLKRIYECVKADRIIAEAQYTSILLNETSIQSAIVRQAEYALEEARIKLSHTVITAPAPGVIPEVYLCPGEVAEPGTAALLYVPDDSVAVMFKALVNGPEAQFVSVGQKALLFRTGSKKDSVAATVFAVTAVNETDHVYSIFLMPDKNTLIPDSCSVCRALLKCAVISDALVLQSGYIENAGETAFATRITDGRTEKKQISVVSAGDDRFIVLSGLAAGDTVIAVDQAAVRRR